MVQVHATRVLICSKYSRFLKRCTRRRERMNNKPVLEFHKGDDILIPITTITQIMI
jgi:hypothetical protein